MAQILQKVDLRRKNIRAVFETVQTHGPLERKNIQAYTGLSWGAISQFTNELLRAGIFIEYPTETKSVGKKPSVIDINCSNNFVIGVDFNIGAIRLLILDLRGNIVHSRVCANVVAGKMFELLVTNLDAMIQDFPKDILAICVSAQGTVDTDHGIAVSLTFDSSLQNLNLKDQLEQHFHIQTFVFHDSDCALVAEMHFGVIKPQHKNVIMLNMNYGIGMSMMFNSVIYNSTSRRQGEIGHILVVPGGALCSCGKRGCLEAYSSKFGIINRFLDHANSDVNTAMNLANTFSISYDKIRDAAKEGDPYCLKLFEDAGMYLGRTIANLSTMFDPDLFVLYGEFVSDNELFRESLQQNLEQEKYTNNRVNLAFSKMGGTAPIQGAVFMAFDRIVDHFFASRIEDF